MSKVDKGPGLGAGWRRGDTAGLEDGIIESSGSLDKESGCHPKSPEKSLESLEAEARSDEACVSKRRL